MALWRRGSAGESRQPETARLDTPGPGFEPGDLPCVAAGCAETTGVRCAYVDRRDRTCPTAWCPAHREVAGGRAYCRRHAGVVRAAASAPVAQLPDLDTRAPGLIEWVARDLDGRIADLLMATGSGDSVTSESAHLVHAGRTRERIWERSWRLCRHTGFVHRIALQVEEGQDTEVVMRVGRHEVARITPPWIEARLGGEVLSPAEDAERRARFLQELLDAAQRGLAEDAARRP